MPNQDLLQRLEGIQSILKGVHQAGAPMSSATKGVEREAFIGNFLSQVLPSPYRFGTGDAIDLAKNRSGQLDVVVEYPFSPSLPLGVGKSRLYLAEGVAAVIEVKSDLAKQWDEAMQTANSLAPLNRSIDYGHTLGALQPKIPLFLAGYLGWKKIETVEQYLDSSSNVAGILVIDPGIFVSTEEYGGITADGPLALWGLVSGLYHATHSLRSAFSDPARYGD